MRRCVWCAEDLASESERCPACGRSQTADDGSDLRLIDIVYEDVVARQRAAYRDVMIGGTTGYAAVAIAAPLVAIAAPVVVGVLLTVHLLILRLHLFRRSIRLLSPKRRFFVRWITRLGLIVAGTFGYSSTLAPVVGAVTGAATFAGLTAATNYYVLRSLKRERLGLPLELWEKITLALLAVLATGLILGLIAIALLIGWGFSELGGMFE